MIKIHQYKWDDKAMYMPANVVKALTGDYTTLVTALSNTVKEYAPVFVDPSVLPPSTPVTDTNTGAATTAGEAVNNGTPQVTTTAGVVTNTATTGPGTPVVTNANNVNGSAPVAVQPVATVTVPFYTFTSSGPVAGTGNMPTSGGKGTAQPIVCNSTKEKCYMQYTTNQLTINSKVVTQLNSLPATISVQPTSVSMPNFLSTTVKNKSLSEYLYTEPVTASGIGPCGSLLIFLSESSLGSKFTPDLVYGILLAYKLGAANSDVPLVVGSKEYETFRSSILSSVLAGKPAIVGKSGREYYSLRLLSPPPSYVPAAFTQTAAFSGTPGSAPFAFIIYPKSLKTTKVHPYYSFLSLINTTSAYGGGLMNNAGWQTRLCALISMGLDPNSSSADVTAINATAMHNTMCDIIIGNVKAKDQKGNFSIANTETTPVAPGLAFDSCLLLDSY